MDIALKYRIIEKVVQSTDDVLLNEINLLISLSEDGFWDDLPVEVKDAVTKAKSELAVAHDFLHT